MSAPIQLTISQEEGFLVGCMLDAAIEQYENTTIEEQSDPDLIYAYAMWKRIRALLPTI